VEAVQKREEEKLKKRSEKKHRILNTNLWKRKKW